MTLLNERTNHGSLLANEQGKRYRDRFQDMGKKYGRRSIAVISLVACVMGKGTEFLNERSDDSVWSATISHAVNEEDFEYVDLCLEVFCETPFALYSLHTCKARS